MVHAVTVETRVSGGRLPLGVRRFAVGRLTRDQKFAENMKIASQDAQADIANEPQFRPIATTCQAVTPTAGHRWPIRFRGAADGTDGRRCQLPGLA